VPLQHRLLQNNIMTNMSINRGVVRIDDDIGSNNQG